ncbi:MAG: alpha/beta hydrolase [Clostridiales bacterium]|nr:alpha/beta hydrolase [Clostridiales bacterium]
MGGIKKIVVERTRKNFIKMCTEADMPRMAKEVYPEDVHAIRDLTYIDDGNIFHRFDIYLPKGVSFENITRRRVILDIHGGGFVYGLKEINMNFNMNVAKRTGLPVVSINYTLVPHGSITNIINEIVTAIDHIKKTYDIDEFVLMGDSAGGYLAYATWAVLADKDIRHDFSCFHDPKVKVDSLILICPAATDSQHYTKALQEAYFSENDHDRLPEYARKLSLVTEKCKFAPPKMLLITSDKDSMHEETLSFRNDLKELGIEPMFFDGVTKEDGNPLFHVYVVGHPEWPESDRPLSMMTDLVVK